MVGIGELPNESVEQNGIVWSGNSRWRMWTSIVDGAYGRVRMDGWDTICFGPVRRLLPTYLQNAFPRRLPTACMTTIIMFGTSLRGLADVVA